MIPIPWSYVHSWSCNGCGLCCREFDVVLKFNEWLKIIQAYGIGVTKAGLNRFYIGKKDDGSCIFSYRYLGRWLCGLQRTKPMACKLWPFKVVDKPAYGKPKFASFNYNGRHFFVYIDPVCPEIRWGNPTPEVIYRVIPEFIEIALGLREKQVYSTSSMLYNLIP